MTSFKGFGFDLLFKDNADQAGVQAEFLVAQSTESLDTQGKPVPAEGTEDLPSEQPQRESSELALNKWRSHLIEITKDHPLKAVAMAWTEVQLKLETLYGSNRARPLGEFSGAFLIGSLVAEGVLMDSLANLLLSLHRGKTSSVLTTDITSESAVTYVNSASVALGFMSTLPAST